MPNLWINHFLRDDLLLISYHEPIEQISESKQFWERYKGYDETIDDGAILHFLKAVKKYSEIDITEIAQQIQEKADMMPIKHPREFGDFKFDIQAFLDKE